MAADEPSEELSGLEGILKGHEANDKEVNTVLRLLDVAKINTFKTYEAKGSDLIKHFKSAKGDEAVAKSIVEDYFREVLTTVYKQNIGENEEVTNSRFYNVFYKSLGFKKLERVLVEGIDGFKDEKNPLESDYQTISRVLGNGVEEYTLKAHKEFFHTSTQELTAKQVNDLVLSNYGAEADISKDILPYFNQAKGLVNAGLSSVKLHNHVLSRATQTEEVVRAESDAYVNNLLSETLKFLGAYKNKP